MPTRILIAEDNADLAQSLHYVLGFEPGLEAVGYVTTAREAVAAVGSLRADVLVCDLQLRDGTAFDVLDRLGADATSKLRVIVHTGYRDPALQSEVERRGAAYVVKPDLDRLLQAVHAAKPL